MNTVRKSPWTVAWSSNSNVADLILTVFNSEKNKANNKWKDNFEILKNFLDYYSVDWNNGLIEEISKIWSISFDMLKDDGFYVEQIIWDDKNTSSSTLHNILHNPNFGTLGADIEKVAIQKLIEKIKGKVPSNLRANFDKEINNPQSLNELRNQIWNFFEFGWVGVNNKVDKNIQNEIKKTIITNKDIVDWLVAGNILWSNDISWNFKNWNPSYKKSFDKLITQEYLDDLKKSVAKVEKTLNTIKDSFTNFIPNMWWVMDKYPFDWKELENHDPDLAERINKSQEEGDVKESNRLVWEWYIALLKNKNQNLWDIFLKLYTNTFDFSILDKQQQNVFLGEMVKWRLEELKNEWIANILDVNQEGFDDFVKNIFDLEKSEIVIPTARWDIKLWVSKKLKSWKNERFMEWGNFSQAKLPIELDIKILDENRELINTTLLTDIFSNELSDDGKSLLLGWENIGKLLLLFVLAERSFDKKDFAVDNIEKLKRKFEVLDKKNDLNISETDHPPIVWNQENRTGDIITESVEGQDGFMDSRKNIRWYQFSEDTINFWFKNGTRLWVKWGDTELPPLDVWGDQRIQFELKNVNNNSFTVKLTWGELSTGSMEWKEFTYPKNKEVLDNFVNAFDREIYKLPSVKDWDNALNNIKASNISNLNWLWVFDELELKWNTLQSRIIEWNPEITHFGSMQTTIPDTTTWLEKKEIVNYAVKFKSNWTVDVTCNNYKRNMDYNNFILFISTKRLKPKTKEDIEEENREIEKWPTHTWSKWKFFGIKSVINMVKSIGKKVNEWIKKRWENQDKNLYNTAMGDWRIANKLQWLIWRIPWVWDALENMDTDFQNSIDAETWKKTDEFLKKIEWHNDFGSIFDNPDYMNNVLWRWVSLKQMVINWKLPGGLGGDKRFVASALLLAQINKWPWPYEKLESYRFKWIWVKLLLGEPYYSKFMKDQAEIIAEMKAKQWLYGPGYDAQLASDLARAEMTFLINNIWWRAPGQRLGCMETGDMKDNAKKLWSDQFAWKLEEQFNGYMSRTKVEEWAGKLDNVHNFTFAYIEYRRFLEAGKPTKALPYLKKMAQLAKSPDQIRRFKFAIIYGMLTGFFLHHTLPWTQVWIQGICRSFWFSPWLWAPHIDHQRKLAHFLQIASGGSFASLWYRSSDFDFGKAVKYQEFREKLEPRWSDNASKIDTFLNEGMFQQTMNDPIIEQLKSSSMEAQQEDIDQDVSKNSALIKNYPLSLTKWVISQISRYDNWVFLWRDNDEIQRSQDAWNAIAGAIPKWSVEKWRFIYTTKRFLNWFDDTFDWSSKEDLVKVFATVKKYRNKLRNWWVISQDFEWSNIGEIGEKDISNLMRYMTSWRIFQRKSAPPQEYRGAVEAFEKMFWDNIDSIDENFISQTFWSEYVKDFSQENSYQLMPRNIYTRITQIWTGQLDDREKRLKTKYLELNNKWVFINRNLQNLYENLNRKMSCPPLWWELKQDDKIQWFI
jgi:hypothetical protein